MGYIFPQIKALHQPAELLQTDAAGDLVCVRWPDKLVTLQALLPQAESVAVPVQRLDLVARAVGKNVQGAGKGTQAQLKFHEHREAVDALSEVNRFATQVHLIDAATWVHQCTT